MTKNRLLILIGALVLTTSCNIFGIKDTPVDGSNSKVENLVGIEWQLSSFISADNTKIDLNEDEEYYIKFGANDTLRGTADCNSYGAPFSAQNGGKLKIENIITTEVYCGEESHIDQYYNALGAADEYEVSENTLRIGFKEKGMLIFRRN